LPNDAAPQRRDVGLSERALPNQPKPLSIVEMSPRENFIA